MKLNNQSFYRLQLAENVTLLCKSIKIEKKIIITRFSALSTRQEQLCGVLIFNQILLTTMLTIKILFTINSLEKKKKLFIQNTIYNYCRFKKHLI